MFPMGEHQPHRTLNARPTAFSVANERIYYMIQVSVAHSTFILLLCHLNFEGTFFDSHVCKRKRKVFFHKYFRIFKVFRRNRLRLTWKTTAPVKITWTWTCISNFGAKTKTIRREIAASYGNRFRLMMLPLRDKMINCEKKELNHICA